MTIGIIVAMDKEYEAIVKAWLPNAPLSRNERVIKGCRMIRLYPSEENEVVLVWSGIGKVNAAIATLELASENVDCIISSGVAGGAAPYLQPGQTIIGLHYHYHDVYCGKEVAKGQVQGEREFFGADDKLIKIAASLQIEKCLAGAIVSGDQFVDSKQEMGRILDEFPFAIAVDMESCAIAQVCYKMDIPFISFRMLSDVVLNPAAKCYEDFGDKAPLQMASNTMRFVMKVINEYKPF